jgi:hypothetical protein
MKQENDIIVYCYFLKSDPNELYAFTINKEYKKLFEKQRCMKKFIYGKKVMNDLIFRVFSNENSNKMIHEDVITDETENFTILLTVKESDEYSESVAYIADFLSFLQNQLKYERDNFVIYDKYLDFISEITDLLMYDRNNEGYLNINTFKLFSYLFRETLYVSDEIPNDFYNLSHRKLI